jgi:AraC-like DNA-binding protein
MKNLEIESGCRPEVPTVNRAGEERGLDSENWQRIERTISYMIEHLNRPLQACDLAAVANISLSHYFTLFKRATGCAPIDFFIRLRMNRARQLLETTALNIKEIAGELGYDDPFYFSRLFKSVNGVAPTDYRKTHQDPVNFGGARGCSDSVLNPDWNGVRHESMTTTNKPSTIRFPPALDIVH